VAADAAAAQPATNSSVREWLRANCVTTRDTSRRSNQYVSTGIFDVFTKARSANGPNGFKATVQCGTVHFIVLHAFQHHQRIVAFNVPQSITERCEVLGLGPFYLIVFSELGYYFTAEALAFILPLLLNSAASTPRAALLCSFEYTT